MVPTERESGVPPGWTRLMVQIPLDLAKIFRVASDAEGRGGNKVLGTAMVACFLGAPAHVRDALAQYALVAMRGDPNNVSIEEAWKVLLTALAIGERREGESPTHYISRILDPELTPAAGQKASDHAKSGKRKAG